MGIVPAGVMAAAGECSCRRRGQRGSKVGEAVGAAGRRRHRRCSFGAGVPAAVGDGEPGTRCGRSQGRRLPSTWVQRWWPYWRPLPSAGRCFAVPVTWAQCRYRTVAVGGTVSPYCRRWWNSGTWCWHCRRRHRCGRLSRLGNSSAGAGSRRRQGSEWLIGGETGPVGEPPYARTVVRRRRWRPWIHPVKTVLWQASSPGLRRSG